MTRLSLSLAVLALGISVAPHAANASGGACRTVTVSEKQNGASASLPAGGSLVVRLRSNASTGYMWQVTPGSNSVLRLVGKPQYVAPSTALIGAPGQQIFLFDAVADGAATLTLNYARPWEKNVLPAKVFRLTVHVRRLGDKRPYIK